MRMRNENAKMRVYAEEMQPLEKKAKVVAMIFGWKGQCFAVMQKCSNAAR